MERRHLKGRTFRYAVIGPLHLSSRAGFSPRGICCRGFFSKLVSPRSSERKREPRSGATSYDKLPGRQSSVTAPLKPASCRIPIAFSCRPKLPQKWRVSLSNNPENGRVKAATPPKCNSPLSFGGDFFVQFRKNYSAVFGGSAARDRMYSSITRSSTPCSRRTYSIASRTAPWPPSCDVT